MAGLPELDASDRPARIAEIRRQIAAGVYETPEKLEQAIDALLDRLALDRLAPGPPATGQAKCDPKPKPK
jgi:hypothetical protein